MIRTMSVMNNVLRGLRARVTGKGVSTLAQVRELLSLGQIDVAARSIDQINATTHSERLQLLCVRGEIAFRQHDDTLAEELFREVLREAPGLEDAHHGLSLLFLAKGQPETALRYAQFAAEKGTAARFSAQLGRCHLQLGNVSRAGPALRRATRLDQNDKASWNDLGIVRRALGDWQGARLAFRRALQIDPAFAQASANLAQLDQDPEREKGEVRVPQAVDRRLPPDPRLADVYDAITAGDLEGAVDRCELLRVEFPDEAVFAVELAALYRALGDAQMEIEVLVEFKSRHPQDVDGISALGRALVRSQEFVAAKPLVETALAARHDDVELLMAMAEIRVEQDRYADAGELLERALKLRPSDIQVKGRLASNLITQCQYERGLALVDEMLLQDPSTEANVASMQTIALTYLGRHSEVLDKLQERIKRWPNDPHLRFSRASILLMEGNFAEGWDDYAYRHLDSTQGHRMLPFPMWGGESLEGKSILIAAEQGLGDQIMFASCLPDVIAQKPRRVVVEAIDRIAPTIARSFPQCEVIPTQQDKGLDWVRAIGRVDCFCLMGDLPQRFRRGLDQFPRHCGYLVADAQRVDHWRKALTAIDRGRKPRIGISWRGGVEATRTQLRSVDVRDFAPLASAKDATWVCLQYGDVGTELLRAADVGFGMHYWAEAISNLDDFAALVSSLDLVITVCNTTVHYSGALSKPVWVLAPKVPEWRYGLHGESLPWYPSSRVFRQPALGDWSEVFERVMAELRKNVTDWVA
jgi:tetratricopeptide (TPR) repeat protein